MFSYFLLSLMVGTLSQPPDQPKIKLGLLFPLKNQDITLYSGFAGSGGAVPVAVDRILREQLLPGYNISFVWYFDECDPTLAAGYAVRLIEEDKVDAIFGSTCASSALITAPLTKYYDIPMLTWSVFYSLLADPIRYPTVTMLNGDTYTMAVALTEIMKLYQWTEFAFIFNVATAISKCSYLATDLERAVSTVDGLSISYKRGITVTDADIQATLKNISQRARIVVACLDNGEYKRQFLLNIRTMSMDTIDYVYILIDTMSTGYYSGGTMKPIYVDNVDPVDGRDDDAKAAALRAFTLDFEVSDPTLLVDFRKQVTSRVHDWPFYCDNITCPVGDGVTVAYMARHLYNAIIAYAYTINKTLTEAGPEKIRSGTFFCTMTPGLNFTGVISSITVSMNEIGNRNQRAFLTGMDNSQEIRVFVEVAVVKNQSSVTATITEKYTDAAGTIWATRNGIRPRAIPICGFDGKSCPPDFWRDNLVYVAAGIAAGVLVLLLLVLVIIFIIRSKQKQLERLNMLWQIPIEALSRIDKASNKAYESMHSLRSQNSSTKSQSTRISMEQRREDSKFAFYFLDGNPVTVEKHCVLVTLYEKDHAQLRQVCDERERTVLQMSKLDHENINRFLGLTGDGSIMMSVWKLCSRGSLMDVIAKGQLTLDSFIISMLMRDLSEGLNALHRSFLTCHGHLTSKNVLVDERWKIKISQYGLDAIRDLEPYTNEDLLWSAPEVLRSKTTVRSKEADVYSFAIICSEIVSCQPPFNHVDSRDTVDEIIRKVKQSTALPFRPHLTIHGDVEVNSAVLHLIRDCWTENPNDRPGMETVRNLLKSMTNTGNKNLMDHVFSVLEQYAGNLEEEVNERMKELTEEKKKTDILLYRLLPRQVADKLKLGLSVEPEAFDSVTIFLSDVVSFTTLAGKCTPLQVVNLLNDMYTVFDGIIEEHDVYKVETIGDGYLCVSGLPHRNGNEHARQIADMALAFLRSTASFRIPHLPSERIQLRIGIHTGSCIAGVVGVTMPRYCLFGDNVNIASRMESGGKPGQIHMSSETNRFLTTILGGYMTEARGETIVKGQGVLQTYWLLGKSNGEWATPPQQPSMWVEFREKNERN